MNIVMGTLVLLTAQDAVKLKRHEFRDVMMGNAVAFTALCPDGWTSKGHVEWSAPPVAYPQANFEMNSPEGGRVKYVPALTFTYSEWKNGQMAPIGMAPPRDLGAWVCWAMAKNTRRKVTNVALVGQRRDPKAEEARARMLQQMGLVNPNIRRECHVVTFDFDENGVRWREDLVVDYVRNTPVDAGNLWSYLWSLYTEVIYVAPVEKFDAMKPALRAVAATVRPDPLWWVRQQEVIGELQRAQAAANWKAILERGAAISKASDAQMAAWRKHQAASDEAQKGRIDAIYERQDYRDVNGEAVKLPIHYKHVYSDGAGNYTLSNSPLNGGGWTEITPVK